MSFLSDLKLVLDVIWGSFFAWMPLALQIVFGAIVAISFLIMIVKVVALIMDALPFV